MARGAVCPYLSEPSRPLSLRFKICRGMPIILFFGVDSKAKFLGNVRWTPRRRRRNWHFISVSPQEVGLLSAEHSSPTKPAKHDESQVESVPWVSLLSTLQPSGYCDLLGDCSRLETQLFQYCEIAQRQPAGEGKLTGPQIYKS